MGNLPTLRREHQDGLALDSAGQVTPVLIALARTWREDPVGIAALFIKGFKVDLSSVRGE